MEIKETFYTPSRKGWRAWLKKNQEKKKEVWLIYYRKASGRKRIPYNDAVEEALCFGWIDSTVKKVDDDSFAQRFTPRRRDSRLSQMNRERIRKLIIGGRMTPKGLAAVSHAFVADLEQHEKTRIPSDILDAIRKDKCAWKHFQNLPESYKRIRIAYIISQKRHGTAAFKRSLENFIKMTARNKRFGMVKE
jgi:uncharacterized protein YdeI (YjbR/CyaY-like superfamily)